MFWIDKYYLLLVIPAALIALWAQLRVTSTFKKYDRTPNARGLTAATVARMILDQNGLQGVRIEQVSGRLTDHYDPRSNIVRLSDAVFSSTSIGAIGVAAHECGHAIQYQVGYFPIRLRSFLIPVTTIGSNAAIPLAIFGLFLGWGWLVDLGILLFLVVVLFQLVTLPVEFNASSRALHILDSEMILSSQELVGTKKVLSAAALTYVAALIVALANLLRLILLRNRK